VQPYRRTCLHWAAEEGHEELCALLLSHKADPNFKDKGSATPLHKAAWNGRTSITTLLLKHNANPGILDADGQTAAQGAAIQESEPQPEEPPPAEAAFEAKRKVSAMIEAAQRGDVPTVEACLEDWPADACTEPYRRTCLHWAAEIGHEPLCRLLLSRQADPNFEDRDQATPLHKASWNDNLDVVRLLLQHKADPNRVDAEGQTPGQGAGSPLLRDIFRDLKRPGYLRGSQPGRPFVALRVDGGQQAYDQGMAAQLATEVWAAFVSHQPHVASRFLLSGRSSTAVSRWYERNGGELLRGSVLSDVLDALSHTNAGPYGPDAVQTLVSPLRRVARASVMYLLDCLAAVRGHNGQGLALTDPPRSAQTVSRPESSQEVGVEAWQAVVKLRLRLEQQDNEVSRLDWGLGSLLLPYMDI